MNKLNVTKEKFEKNKQNAKVVQNSNDIPLFQGSQEFNPKQKCPDYQVLGRATMADGKEVLVMTPQ